MAEIDATNETAPQVAKTYLWDPSESVATRILHINVWNNGEEMESLYCTHDLQKNVTALFGRLHVAGRSTNTTPTATASTPPETPPD